jgi:Outer membrane protein beta-barrel domain
MRVLSAGLVLVALCAPRAMAQEGRWGVKGGVNFATFSSDDEPAIPFDYRIGLAAGGFFTWPIGSHLDIQPEALYSQQGTTLDVLGVDSAIKIDYLATPILVRFRLQSSGRGLVLFAGPSLGFKLSAKAVSEFGDVTTKDDIGDEIESFDYGVVFGAGWEAGRLMIDGRYTWGLSNISTREDDPKTQHRVISVLAGVRF